MSITKELLQKDKRRNNQTIDDNLINSFRRTYYNWEKGVSYPDIIQLDIICGFLDCDYDFLMCRIDVPKKEIYDVKEVTGLSENAIKNLELLYDCTKFSLDSKYRSVEKKPPRVL